MAVKFITLLVLLHGVFDVSFAQRQRPSPPPPPSRGGSNAVACDREPPIRVSPRDCCDIVYIFDNSTAAKCMNTSRQVSNVHVGIKGPLDGMECFFSCLFNATGAISNGQINVPALKTYASSTLTSASQTKWSTVVNEAIDFCHDLTTKSTPRINQSLKGKTPDNQNICSPIPQFMGSCIYFRQIAKCPFKGQQSAQCNQLQQFYQNCPTPELH